MLEAPNAPTGEALDVESSSAPLAASEEAFGSPLVVDVVVIEMGPEGEAVADALLKKGLSVVGVEAELIGGECADWGCVPTKMMVRAANLLKEAHRVNALAGTATVKSDWPSWPNAFGRSDAQLG